MSYSPDIRKFALLLITSLSIFGCGSRPLEILTKLEKTHNDQQVEEFVSCFADTATFSISGGWSATGLAEIRGVAEWDAAINSRLQFSNVTVRGDTVFCRLREDNDWFRQMSLQSIIYDSVWVVIQNNKVVRVEALQRSTNLSRANRLFNDFLQWASRSRSGLLVHLMHGASFVFTKETAGSWLALLAEWRMSISRPPEMKYRITAQIRDDLSTIDVEQEVTILSDSRDTLHEITIDLAWDPISPPTIRLGGSAILPTGYLRHGILKRPLVFDLPDGLSGGRTDSLTIVSTITAASPDHQRCTILDDWYGRVGIMGGGESHTDFDISITAPSGIQIASSGIFSQGISRMRADDIRRFGIAYGRNFGTAARNVGTTTVRTFLHTDRSALATPLIESVAQCLNFLGRGHGIFPYPVLTIVESDYDPFDLTQLPTGFVGVDVPKISNVETDNLIDWQIAHQLSRQYWCEYVLTTEQDSWLAFGLATDMTSDYLKDSEIGDGFAAQILRDYSSAMLDGDTILLDSPVWVRHSDANDRTESLRLSKGYAFVMTVEYLLGDSYDRVVRRCLQEYAGEYLNPYGFQNLCEQEFAQDLEWLFKPWMRTNSVLSYIISNSACELYGDRYVTAITIERLGSIRMPIPVAARFADGTVQVAYSRMNAEQQTLAFESLAPLVEAELDPEGRLPLILIQSIEEAEQL